MWNAARGTETRIRRNTVLRTVFFLLAVAPGCKESKHARVASYVAPPLPAGFVEREGSGWRIAVPSTWKDKAGKGPWALAVADPQAVDDLRASVNVIAEPFGGESFEYARASEAALRREPRATIEVSREDVVDGDPTLFIESRWLPVAPLTVGYRTLQSALASSGQGYLVTCAVASIAFERYRSTCESVVRSFAVER
jgi:hypothetical protein